MDGWDMITFTTRWIMENVKPLPFVTKIDLKYDTPKWFGKNKYCESETEFGIETDVDLDPDQDLDVDLDQDLDLDLDLDQDLETENLLNDVVGEVSETESEGCDEWDLI